MNFFFLVCGCLFGAAVTILFQLAEPDPTTEHVDTDDVLEPRVTDGDLYFTKDTAA